MKKTAPIPHNDWLTALHELEGVHEEDQDALTTTELAILWTCSRSAALHRVQVLVRRGRAQQVTKRRFDAQHRAVTTTAYKLIPLPDGDGE